MRPLLDSLRGSSIKIGTIQRKLAWPLRKHDTHKSRSVNNTCDHCDIANTCCKMSKACTAEELAMLTPEIRLPAFRHVFGTLRADRACLAHVHLAPPPFGQRNMPHVIKHYTVDDRISAHAYNYLYAVCHAVYGYVSMMHTLVYFMLGIA